MRNGMGKRIVKYHLAVHAGLLFFGDYPAILHQADILPGICPVPVKKIYPVSLAGFTCRPFGIEACAIEIPESLQPVHSFCFTPDACVPGGSFDTFKNVHCV